MEYDPSGIIPLFDNFYGTLSLAIPHTAKLLSMLTRLMVGLKAEGDGKCVTTLLYELLYLLLPGVVLYVFSYCL